MCGQIHSGHGGFYECQDPEQGKDFGLGLIHDDSFSGRKTVCTPFNELGEMGGLVYREKMEKGSKNTTRIATLVLKVFQFTSSFFNCLSQ